MKRLRSVAVYSVAALATGAVLAASASAAPPEFSGPFPKPFTSKSGKVIVAEEMTRGVEKLVCRASTDTGEIFGPKNGRVSMRLKRCRFDENPAYACTTLGAEKEEIITSTLLMTLGYINKAKGAVGLALEPELPMMPIANFECAAGLAHVTWGGSVIGKLTPINVQPPGHFTLNFTQAEGKQKPTKLEGGATDVLMGRRQIGNEPWEESELGLAAKDEIAFTAPVEVKA